MFDRKGQSSENKIVAKNDRKMTGRVDIKSAKIVNDKIRIRYGYKEYYDNQP